MLKLYPINRLAHSLTTTALTALLMLLALQSSGQGIPCPQSTSSFANAGLDTTICPAQCATLTGTTFTTLRSTLTYAAATTLYTPDSFGVGTPVPVVGDDNYSQVVPLGFEFCYFGNKYTSCIIAMNGTLSFNVGNAGGGSGFTLNGAIPNNYLPYNNSIMAPYHDLNPVPPNGGTITYQVLGAAPCRRFVVTWNAVKLFGSCSSVTATQQIKLYESTNVIDIVIGNKPLCTSWIQGMAVLGIQNAAGTVAYSFPGRNNAQWSETNAAYRFTPNATPVTTYVWKNLTTGGIIATTPTVTVCPPDTTKYELYVKHTSQCDSVVLRDTVRVNVNNSVAAGYTYRVGYGCSADTVFFTNTSTGIDKKFEWAFGDGTFDTSTNPVHIYPVQGFYNVRLIAINGPCRDTVIQNIDLYHPLDAAFTISTDSACQQETISFTNTTTATSRLGIDPSYVWYFMDGDTSHAQSPTHTYTRTGVYRAMLVVKDFVPCFDTAYKTIVIDSIPYVKIIASDTVACEGQAITFTGDFLALGNTGHTWEFQDGTIVDNVNPIIHAYDSAGTYNVKLTSYYRICPLDSARQTIVVKPYPTINLGPDTVLCPGNAPVIIADLNVAQNLGSTYLWSNGDTAVSSILARDAGTYWATVTRNGCSSTDSVVVNKDCYIDIPNAFTPNGDGDNDYFFPRQLLSRSLNRFRMAVFNRWGQKVFESTALDGRGWDGRFNGQAQPAGVYIYQIEAEMENGTAEKHTGNVTLLR